MKRYDAVIMTKNSKEEFAQNRILFFSITGDTAYNVVEDMNLLHIALCM